MAAATSDPAHGKCRRDVELIDSPDRIRDERLADFGLQLQR